MICPTQFRFFLDSGAFSAWSKGTPIDLDHYIAFIKYSASQDDLLEVYASLDVIPGAPGKVPTPAQRDAAADQSWANYLYMKAEGTDPLPVYHYGEHVRHLDRMLDYGCQYIGIGALVGVPSPRRQVFLDKLFLRLTGADGKVMVKTHGFGMTSVPLIFRYPWYSVDSTTWIQITKNGGVYLPATVNGEFVFDRVPLLVTVSNKSPKFGTKKGGAAVRPMVKARLLEWLRICGRTYEQVEEHYYSRAVCNVRFFKMVSDQKTDTPGSTQRIIQSTVWDS